MSAMMLLFWGLVIGLVVWAVRSLRSAGQRADAKGGGHAMDGQTSDERIAKFESKVASLRASWGDEAEHRRAPWP